MDFRKFFKNVLTFILIGLSVHVSAQNSVGIGTENPNARAVLELVSPTNNQGLLVPKMTTAQRTAAAFVGSLTQTENGLMVYDTNLGTFFYWLNNGWQLVSGLALTAGDNITISPAGVVSAQFAETQNLTLANNILRITNNVNATNIDLTPYLNVQTAAQVVVTPNANLLAVNVQAALVELQTEILAANTGGMLATVYDPTNIAGNAFDLAIHTGNLPNTRITGLGTASTFNVGTALNNVVQIGANGLPAIGGSLLTGLSLSQFDDLGDLATLDAVGTAQITNNTILNEDISPSALIAGTKVVPSFGPQNISTSGTITGDEFFGDGSGLTNVSVADGTVTGGIGLGAKIAANTITNDNISTTAAIAGTKVNPNFGDQDISTTGKLTTGGFEATDTDPSSTTTALAAVSYSNQPQTYAISGIHEGTGDVAGYFLSKNPASTFSALYGETRGTGGVGVMGTVGTTGTGYGGFFSNFNSGNNSFPTVLIETAGTGTALRVNGKTHIADGTEGLGKILVSDAGGVASWQEATGTSWGLVGNAGTVAGTNFIGTTDTAPLIFKVNNENVGELDNDGNVFFGLDAGVNNTTTDNTFIGSNSGQANSTGNLNAFYGSGSGANNTIGSSNSFLGFWAGRDNTTGNQNTFVGHAAGRSNTTASNNAFFGESAGVSNTTGSENSFFGRNTGVFNTSGSSNSFFGYVSGYFNTTGLGNSSFGFSAGSDNTTGGFNTSMGYQAANLNTIGTQNTMIGAFAGKDNTSSGNSFVGYGAGTKNTSGGGNSFFGRNAGTNNTSARSNSFFGNNAGFNNTTANDNSYFGENSGFANLTGVENAFFGTASGNSNVASWNAFFGYTSGEANTSGQQNSFYGSSSARNNTSGFNNTSIGFNSLSANLTGSRLTVIGHNANVGVDGLTNATAIGANAIVGASNSLILGGTGGNSVNVGIGTTTPGHKLEVFGSGNAFGHTDGNVVVESQIAGNDAWFGTASANHNFHLLAGGFDAVVIRGDNNNMGVGRVPTSNRLEVEGEASKTTAGTWVANSDRRIKTDIREITNSFELIKKLRPVKFKYTDAWMAKHPSIKNQYYYNFIAQEYQQVFPESVHQSGEFIEGDEESILQIDTYNAQIATIKAVQELINKVEALEKENTILKAQNEALAANQALINQQIVQLNSLKDMIKDLKLVGKNSSSNPISVGEDK